jgi:cell division septum initiation protein DivIVA
MEIQTSKKSRFGNVVTIGGEDVSFDQFGIAKVSTEFGKKLLVDYPETIFPKGEVQSSVDQITKEIRQELVSELDQSLTVERENAKDKIERLTKKITDLESNLVLKQKEIDEWKEAYEKAKAETLAANQRVIELEEAISKTDLEHPSTPIVLTDEDKLIEMLMKKTFEEMKAYAEQLELPKEEWKNLRKPEKLANYIAESVLKLDDGNDKHD